MQVEDVNKLLAQYRQMQRMFKQMTGKGSKKKMKRMQSMMGGGGFPGMPM